MTPWPRQVSNEGKRTVPPRLQCQVEAEGWWGAVEADDALQL